jgi:NHL repeat
MKTTDKTNLYAAATLIVVILAALGVRIWAADRSLSIEGPANIKAGPDGLVYIVTDSRLYIHDRDGGLVDVEPMTRFGMERAKGDFWVFRNGDLLLRRETKKRLTCRRELETFFRNGSSKQDKIDADAGILERCDLRGEACVPFGRGDGAFKKIGAFKVFVDETKGFVYLTDTPAHQVLLYDLSGALIRKSDAYFLYPNGLVKGADGLLYVADTNHHRIAAVSPEYADFGRVERQFSILNTVSPPGKEWPFALGQDRNGRWWVINAGAGMRHGDLVIYNADGEVFRRVELPDNAEPTALAVLNDKVLVTDADLMRVYSVALNGELGEDFGSLTLKIDNADKLREKDLYSAISACMLYVILAGAVAAIVIAWKAQRGASGERAPEKGAKQPETKSAPGGEPRTDAAAPEAGGEISVPRLPASQGWTWLSDAVALAMKSFRLYGVLFLVGLLRWQGVLKIPKVGYPALLLVSPLITGLMMLPARMVDVDNALALKKVRIGRQALTLLSLGGISCLILGLSAAAMQVMTGRPLLAAVLGMPGRMRGGVLPEAAVPMLFGALFILLVLLVFGAAVWFAPPLIVLKRVSLKQSLALSFKASVRNAQAFFLYGVVLSGIFVFFAIALFVVPGLLFIPLGLTTFIAPTAWLMGILFWPAVAPILTLSIYTSYARVFESAHAEAGEA